MKNTRRILTTVIISVLLLSLLTSCGKPDSGKDQKIHLDTVIMAMFEIGEFDDDVPGEAQLFYEEYFTDPDVYDITEDPYGCRLYVENGIGLCLLGQGKSSSAVNTAALLSDERFDFSDTFFLATGCAGSSKDYGVVGDVFIITSAVDYELGYSADIRDLGDESDPVWYRIDEYDPVAYHLLNPELTEHAYELTKDIKLETTDSARSCMARNFDNAEWAVRDPMVLKGASVTADNYWKGEYNHQRAVYITEAYNTPDPYAATIMEDSAVALAFEKFGMLDQLLIIRASVNVDVFIDGDTPESLWGGSEEFFDDGFDGFDDIFPVAMENCFKVGKTIIDDLRNGGIANFKED